MPRGQAKPKRGDGAVQEGFAGRSPGKPSRTAGRAKNKKKKPAPCRRHHPTLHIKQHFQIFPRQRLPRLRARNNRIRHAFLGGLQAQNLLFHSILADQFI